MPLGFERLNERTQRPNALINFIKPLKTATPEDQAIAQNFLERIAAQCYPVMKKDHISVMALEEYAPNPEFIGRNFNAGEVIQLVLRDKAGRWLGFNNVQMVMMHELAHCKQMNHSRYFWNERNRFAAHMEELWAAGYKGEGSWGRGQNLSTGTFVPDRTPVDADVPPHLCGGVYRRGRGRKRKRGDDTSEKPKVTYAERQQKRIAKKFGVHGEGHNVGEDDLVRGALEQRSGKRHQGKPRVANSKRGRELRAQAALARFEQVKQTPERTPELDEDDGSETESDDDDGYADGMNILNTLEQIKDRKGKELFKVCGAEDEQDEGGQEEMEQFRRINGQSSKINLKAPPKKVAMTGPQKEDSETESDGDEVEPLPQPKEDSETESETEPEQATQPTPKPGHDPQQQPPPTTAISSPPTAAPSAPAVPVPTNMTELACPICSLENEPAALMCMACSHVLKPKVMKNHWRCKGDSCNRSYVNPGDVGRCGLCGAQKPPPERAMGVTSGDLLRWD